MFGDVLCVLDLFFVGTVRSVIQFKPLCSSSNEHVETGLYKHTVCTVVMLALKS